MKKKQFCRYKTSALLLDQRPGDVGGEAGVVEDELDVGGEGVAAGEVLDTGEEVGVVSLP